MSQARLMRSETDKMFAGVCGGLAVYLGVDPVIIRFAFLVLIFASGIGLPLYFILMLIMPSEGDANRPPSDVVKGNLEQLGTTISSGVENIRQHPQGPAIAAGFLIIFGVYLLFNNLGWLTWLHSDLLWPLVIIGLGLFLLIRRAR
ncbi:MAG: PspC domain-containing protein [Chloroflexota bacterium]